MTERILRAIAGIREYFAPRVEFSTEKLRIYVRALQDLPEDEIEGAIEELIRTHDYPPLVSEIRRLVAERRLNLPGANEAWMIVQEAMTLGTVSELPEVIKLALKTIGGTWAIRNTDNTIAIRAQFLKAYDEYRAKALRTITAHRPALVAAADVLQIPEEV